MHRDCFLIKTNNKSLLIKNAITLVGVTMISFHEIIKKIMLQEKRYFENQQHISDHNYLGYSLASGSNFDI